MRVEVINPMAVYMIGRDPDPTVPRIVLEDKSISRKHASLTALGNDKYILEDLGSQNGTFVRERGGWRRIESANVVATNEVRLGIFITTVGAMLQRLVFAPERVRMERNPDTGEIIKRRDER